MTTRIKPWMLTAAALATIMVPMLVHLVQQWLHTPLAPGVLMGPEDPDPWLRLTLVRDLLNGGSWYSHHVGHSDVPFFHTISPWTRPLDVVIAFFTTLQPHSVDLSLRLLRAALIMPVLWMGLLLLGLYRAVKPFSQVPVTPFLISGLIAMCTPMWNYFNTGNADHHSLLAVLFIWGIGGVLKPKPTTRDLILSGILFATQLWVSPEALVFIAGIYGWFGLQWLAGEHAPAKSLATLSTSTALMATLAVLIERPPQAWFIPVYDSISIVYVFILACAALFAWLLYFMNPPNILARLALGACGGLAVIASLWLAYPLMLHGPLVMADPYIFTNFMPRIIEAQTLFARPTMVMLAQLVQPLVVILVLTLAWLRQPSFLTRAQCIQLAYVLGLAFALYVSEVRFYYYFYPLLTLALAPFLATLVSTDHPSLAGRWPVRALLRLNINLQLLCCLALLITIIGLPWLMIKKAPDDSTDASSRIDACLHTARQMIYGGMLNGIGNGKSLNLFISTDLGGEALFWTPHKIVASNYHREGQGIRYIWEADKITDPEKLRRYLRARDIEAMLLCPVVTSPKASVLQNMRLGKALPGWATIIPYTTPPDASDVAGSAPVLFRVHP